MTYTLYIGDRTYSSWSMRGWLMFRAFDVPVAVEMVGLYAGTLHDDLAHLAPARLVPVMQTPAGHVVQDTLAMAETLHEENPNAGLWPTDAGLRALARGMVAEMHAGFGALRSECAMNLEQGWAGFTPTDAVMADVTRIETLWAQAMERSGSDTWLFGDYSLADVFYAPVAARIAGYGLPVGAQAQAYVERHLADPLFRQWRAMGLTQTYTPRPYRMDDAHETPWPRPAPLPACRVDAGPSENTHCPYSGDPVTHYLKLNGRVFGMCNAFCRDKTLADPAAWPQFMALYNS
ncbi:MAG: glutathione S-transferase [Pseudomonadota bacterium]